MFAGHHQPLTVWVLCLYCMGLNVSNEQIAHALALHVRDVQQMTTQLREGIVKKQIPSDLVVESYVFHDTLDISTRCPHGVS